MRRQWFAVATPGLEPIVARELSLFGVEGVQVPGGVQFRAPLEAGCMLTCQLRTPARLLLRLARGDVRNLSALAGLIHSVDWGPLLFPGDPVEVAVSSSRSRLRRREAIAKKASVALRDALRKRERGRSLRIPQRLHVRIEDDRATLSLDAGGELLHRRGWRQSATTAPIRENLAASMLMAAGWAGDESLVDPFCGSGTIPIEAALLAAGRRPWTRRRFAWQGWRALQSVRLPQEDRLALNVAIYGIDHSPKALVAAKENADRADVVVNWGEMDIAHLKIDAPPGLVIANPPYGGRLGQNVKGVFSRFGRTLRSEFEGWRVLFLAPDPELARLVSARVFRLTHFRNGGIGVGIYVIE